MTHSNTRLRALLLTTALAVLSACGGGGGPLDWDLRTDGSLNTSDAARQSTTARPEADGRGVLSYPGYQVAVAQRGDTVASLAARVGLNVDEVARYNALIPTDPLRPGEVLALPQRVAAASAIRAPTPSTGGGIDISAVATTALDRVPSGTPAQAEAAPAADEPVRHKVARGETAYSIARTYNISARSLADWNGLGTDLALREGQFLIIPTALPNQSVGNTTAVTTPGSGSPTPTPPSAAKPLPEEKPDAANAPVEGKPASPDLGAQRTQASATQFVFPVQGPIIRGYAKKKNEGIDISAAAGTSVQAAAAGTVAAITKDTDNVPILVLRHADNLLTVYANIDGITVAKGDNVKRGQKIAAVRNANPAFLHFEIRKGFDSVDPMPYLE